jgi:hypothetical protein
LEVVGLLVLNVVGMMTDVVKAHLRGKDSVLALVVDLQSRGK